MRINIVGDFMPIHEIESKIECCESYDLLDDDIKSILRDSDLNILNLECPLTKSKKPILKTGKNFRSGPNSILFLKEFNFKLACLANNHIMDYGYEGLTDTLNICAANNINCLGINDDKYRIYRCCENNVKVSIINAAEHEFGIGDDKKLGVIHTSPTDLYYLITKERAESDQVILILHGGREFFEYPTPERQSMYRLYIDYGADLIVSHHTHVLSGFEVYKEKCIIYSIGNFLFPFSSHPCSGWYESYICSLLITKEKLTFELIPCIQCKDEMRIRIADFKEKLDINLRLSRINKIILNKVLLEERWDEFCEKEKFHYLHMLSLLSTFKLKLFSRRILNDPKINIDKLKIILNLLRCETHNQESVRILRKELEKSSRFYT